MCVLKNAAYDRGIYGNVAFEVALALQSELEAQELESGASSGVRHYEVGVGNLSGKAIRAIARKSGYALCRLARSDGECGLARATWSNACSSWRASASAASSGRSGLTSMAWRRRTATGFALRASTAQVTGASTAGFSREARGAAPDTHP